MGLVSILILMLGALAALMMKQRYSATATLEVSPLASETSGPASTFNSDEMKSELQTDISILEGDGLAVSTIKALGLENKKPWSAAINPDEKGRPLENAPKTREAMVSGKPAWPGCSSPVRLRAMDQAAWRYPHTIR